MPRVGKITILSSGDNTLNLLPFEPAAIYSYDISPAQIHEAKLKIAAIEQLSYQEFLTLLGYTGTEQQREELYYHLVDHLEKDTLTFWNQHLNLLQKGLSSQGWMERSFSLVRHLIRFFLAEEYVHSLTAHTRQERQVIFEKKINRPMVRALTKLFMNNRPMTHILFHKQAILNIPPTFDYQSYFWRNISRAFVDIGCVNNPYIYWIFTGELLPESQYWQPYLQERHFATLRQHTKKIHIFEQDIYNGLKDLDSDSVDAFYISDIFDWMSQENVEKTLLEIVRVAKKDAKIVCFILNYDKGIPPNLQKQILIDEVKSKEFSAQERVGIYSKINILEIQK